MAPPPWLFTPSLRRCRLRPPNPSKPSDEPRSLLGRPELFQLINVAARHVGGDHGGGLRIVNVDCVSAAL